MSSIPDALKYPWSNACGFASGIQYDGGLMHVRVSMLMEGILNISCEKEFYVVC
jgi:hypothetical protein